MNKRNNRVITQQKNRCFFVENNKLWKLTYHHDSTRRLHQHRWKFLLDEPDDFYFLFIRLNLLTFPPKIVEHIFSFLECRWLLWLKWKRFFNVMCGFTRTAMEKQLYLNDKLQITNHNHYLVVIKVKRISIFCFHVRWKYGVENVKFFQ